MSQRKMGLLKKAMIRLIVFLADLATSGTYKKDE